MVFEWPETESRQYLKTRYELLATELAANRLSADKPGDEASRPSREELRANIARMERDLGELDARLHGRF